MAKQTLTPLIAERAQRIGLPRPKRRTCAKCHARLHPYRPRDRWCAECWRALELQRVGQGSSSECSP